VSPHRSTPAAPTTRREAAAGSRAELLGAAALYGALTVALTYPQVLVLATHTDPHYDALFSIWRLAWIAHQLPLDPLRLFDANIFHPEPTTLAYSDAMLLPGLAGAPLIWAGIGPVTVHNLFLLASFVGCGVAMYSLVRSLTGSRAAAYVAGTMFAFQPYRFGHFTHLELQMYWWMPLACLSLHRLIAWGRTRDGLQLGVWLALQVLCCIYYGVFLATGLVVLATVLMAGRPLEECRRLVRPAVASAMPLVVLLLPYVIPYLTVSRALGGRSEEEVRQWSATIWNYLAAPETNWLYGPSTGHLGHLEGTLFPGLSVVVLAVAAAWAGRRTRTVLAYVVLAGLAIDWSLGANGLTYMLLYHYVPGYGGLRVPARMYALASVGLTVLAGFSAARLLERPAFQGRTVGAAALAVAVVIVEFASMPPGLIRTPERPKIYDFLARQSGAIVAEWPFAVASDLGNTRDAVYMYFSLGHWQRLVNGYSGFHPPSYLRLIERATGFPDERSIRALREVGVQYVVLHSGFAPDRYPAVKERLTDHPDLEILMAARETGNEVALYRLRPAPRAP
jgi:hypothetical protein